MIPKKNLEFTSKETPLMYAILIGVLVLVSVFVCGCIVNNYYGNVTPPPTITERPTGQMTSTTTATSRYLTNQPTAVITPIKTGTGTVYHVAAGGNNANPGTRDQPWQTLQYAVDTVGSGDTIIIHGELTESVQMTTSGQENQPITITGAPGEMATIHGELGFRPGVSYIQLQGLHFDSFPTWGITLWGDNHYIHLANMQMTGGDAGLRMTVGASGEPPEYGPVTDVTLEDSTILNALYTGVDCTPGPCNNIVFRKIEVAGSGALESYGADGIAVERGSNILVEDSQIHDNGGDGIDLNSRDTAGGVPNIVVRRNEVYRNHYSGIKLWSGGLIEKNVVYDQGEGPIVGGDYPCSMDIRDNSVGYNGYDPQFGRRGYSVTIGYSEQATGPAVKLRFVNNIIAYSSRPEGDGPTGIYLGPGIQLVEERNNVFHSNINGEIFAQFLCNPNTDYDTCDIGRNEIDDGTWARLTGQGQGDITIDPQFVGGWPNVDLHLKPGSPAAGHGAY
jgi:hypothetical protein